MDGAKKDPERPRERKSQSEHAPSVPVYWRDWGSDAAWRALPLDCKGGYTDWWLTTHGTKTPGVVSEDALRRAMGLSPARWARVRDAVAACFQIRRDGMWVQKRTAREARAQKKRFTAARESGKRGARKRWKGKEMSRGATAAPSPAPVGTPPVTPMAKTCPYPSPSLGDQRSPSISKTEFSTRVTTDLGLAPVSVPQQVGGWIGVIAERMATRNADS